MRALRTLIDQATHRPAQPNINPARQETSWWLRIWRMLAGKAENVTSETAPPTAERGGTDDLADAISAQPEQAESHKLNNPGGKWQT